MKKIIILIISSLLLISCKGSLEILELNESKVIETQGVKIEILNTELTDRVTPLFNEEYINVKMFYSHYVDITATVTNITDESINLKDLQLLSDYGDDRDLVPQIFIEDNYFEEFEDKLSLEPEESRRVHFSYGLDEVKENVQDILLKHDKDSAYLIPLNIEEKDVTKVTFAETISSDDVDITFNSMNIVKEMTPSNTSGEYIYLYDETGGYVFYFDITIVNKKDHDLELEDAIYFSYYNDFFSDYIFAWKKETESHTDFENVEVIKANSSDTYRLILRVSDTESYPDNLLLIVGGIPYEFVTE